MKEERSAQVAEGELPSIQVPAVYRDGSGDLALALALVNGDTVEFIAKGYRSKSVEYVERSMGAKRFADEFILANLQQYPPIYLALNFIGRASEGAAMSVRVQRRLIDMLSKEELMKLSERALGKEYSRIMGVDIKKIPTDPEKRTKYIEEMLAKLSENPEAPSEPAGESSDTSSAPQTQGDAASTGNPSTPAEKSDDVAKKKPAAAKTKRKKSSEAKQPVTIAKCDRANPYREGSKKHQAFAIYAKGGDRADVVKSIMKCGVTQSTANTWMYFFASVAKTGKQPDWKEKRQPKKTS